MTLGASVEFSAAYEFFNLLFHSSEWHRELDPSKMRPSRRVARWRRRDRFLLNPSFYDAELDKVLPFLWLNLGRSPVLALMHSSA
jgi:hypothetical protein